MPLRYLLTATVLALLPITPSWAATYYVAPQGAAQKCTMPDGSEKCPFRSVVDATYKVQGGDTILLMDGAHGNVVLKRGFDQMVTIQSQNGRNAHLNSVDFGEQTRYYRLKNLQVWRQEGEWNGPAIRSHVASSNLEFDGLDVRSRQNATDYLRWDAARWLAVGAAGFALSGQYNVVRNSSVMGMRVGIVVGPYSLVENNIVDGFCGDGMKGVSNSTFRGNLVKNRVAVDGYHADGFQAFTRTSLQNLTLDSNVIIEWTHAPDHPLRGWLQGIGLYDGFYDNLSIKNNIVAVRHWHGISVYGARGAQIINNTVVNLTGEIGQRPWIKIARHKDGTSSQNVVVANNLAMSFQSCCEGSNVVLSNNSVLTYPARLLNNISTFDYRPKVDSGLIDTGNRRFAPPVDILNNMRPAGNGPDRGAYEVGSAAASTSSGSVGATPLAGQLLDAP